MRYVMKRKVALEKFKTDCLKVIKYYRSDLDIDMKIVGKKVSAVFFAYECGSHAITLPEFERYPAAGERVRYLFGSADRRHILNETGSTLECESVKVPRSSITSMAQTCTE